MRSSGGLSEVDTTTTERLRPSGPRSFSRKPRTSRPRSPTSPSTTTSAAAPRVNMPSSVLLPTPLPPKRPTRWPLPPGTVERLPQCVHDLSEERRSDRHRGGGAAGDDTVARTNAGGVAERHRQQHRVLEPDH